MKNVWSAKRSCVEYKNEHKKEIIENCLGSRQIYILLPSLYMDEFVNKLFSILEQNSTATEY